jgi:triacylglycerol lipase
MYFPPRFKPGLAIELGELVTQAYDQHEAFKRDKPWELSGGYSFICAISCAEKPSGALDWLHPETKEGPLPIGFVARRVGNLYVIFRGTITAGEWMKNLSFNLKPCDPPIQGKAHSGFMAIYASIRDGLIGALSREKGNSRLYVAGHSLGGALATLAAPDIAASTRLRLRALYTFASPRVGDDDFVQAFNTAFGGASFRIVNTSDIVPSIPLPVPIGMGGYFSHVDTPVDFTAQFGAVDKNHEMETYLAALRQAKRRLNPLSLFGRR